MSKSFTPEYSCYFLGGAYLLSSRIAFGDVSYRLIVSRALSWMYRSGPPLVDCDSYPATFVYTSTAVVQFEPGKQRYTSISIFYSRPQHYSGSYGDFYDMIHLNSLHCNTPVQWRALVIPIVIRLMQAPHGWLNLGEGQDTHTHTYIYIYTHGAWSTQDINCNCFTQVKGSRRWEQVMVKPSTEASKSTANLQFCGDFILWLKLQV